MGREKYLIIKHLQAGNKLIAEEFYLKRLNKLQFWVTKSLKHMLEVDLSLVHPISKGTTTELKHVLSWWVHLLPQDQRYLKKLLDSHNNLKSIALLLLYEVV